MSDPKRWSEEEDEAMRAFVSALKVEPAREKREAVWEGVAAALGGGGPEGGEREGGAAKPSAAPPPAASGLGLGAKLLLGTVALVGAGALVVHATKPAPSPVVAAPSARVTSPPPAGEASAAPVASEVPVASAPSATPPAPPPPATAKVAPAPKPTVVAVAPSASASTAPPLSAADRLREETEGVRRARRALRDGDAQAALKELDDLERRFPAGPLEEEREVLRIEALFAAKVPSASRRAERFLLERPQSVHVARIKALLGR